MGYIAPIRIVQYMEYQKRIQESSKVHDPMPVHFTPRISLSPHTRLGKQEWGIPKSYPYESRNTGGKRLPHYTGKGQYINEYI